jgi:hypothetical protein
MVHHTNHHGIIVQNKTKISKRLLCGGSPVKNLLDPVIDQKFAFCSFQIGMTLGHIKWVSWGQVCTT